MNEQTPRKLQMTNKHEKNPTSLIIKEMQIRDSFLIFSKTDEDYEA